MGAYATAQDVLNRYPSVDGIGQTVINSVHILFAEAELNALLASYFTIPFSSNNLTAKDLTIDLTYIRIGNMKVKERADFRKEIMDKINGLINGSISMVLTDGSTIQTVGDTIGTAGQSYHPVFGMGDIEEFHVDKDRIEDEHFERDF